MEMFKAVMFGVTWKVMKESSSSFRERLKVFEVSTLLKSVMLRVALVFLQEFREVLLPLMVNIEWIRIFASCPTRRDSEFK